MPLWHEDFRRTPEAAGWKPQASGFHLVSEYSARAGGKLINWLEGDLSGADKRISRAFPAKEGVSVSMSWEFMFQLDQATASDYVIFHIMSNQEGIDFTVAGYNAYAILAQGNGTLSLLRYTGAGGIVTVHTYAWASDVNEHKVATTREVSGANRFWRTYLDDTLVAGPTNDATYSVASYLGIRHPTTRRQRSAEILMQW